MGFCKNLIERILSPCLKRILTFRTGTNPEENNPIFPLEGNWNENNSILYTVPTRITNSEPIPSEI